MPEDKGGYYSLWQCKRIVYFEQRDSVPEGIMFFHGSYNTQKRRQKREQKRIQQQQQQQ
jgi:hypothetical protein